MGKIKQGIMGSFSGAVGNVVGSSWKGIGVMKVKPASVANPRTAGQIAQRSKFANAVAFAQIILASIIKPLWDRFASQMSGYNDFIKTNIDLFVNEFASPAADLIISRGKMAATPITSVEAINGELTVNINFPDTLADAYQLATDRVYALVVNETSGAVDVSADLNARSSGGIGVDLAEALVTGDQLRVYLAFKRVDGTVVSNTAYLAKVVTAS